MSQLAAACGISKANIYHYYDGKEALLFDLLEATCRGCATGSPLSTGRG
jgi:AcrR family transcriptional regulator